MDLTLVPWEEMANLRLGYPQQVHDTMDSPNAMALDSDDTYVIQPNGTAEKDAVTEIIPDSLNGDADQLPELPLATDCTSSER